MSTVAAVAQPVQAMTLSEFLDWEEGEPLRYEFDGLHVVAMTGAAIEHYDTISNLRDAIRPQLPAGCRVLTETFKLLYPRPGLDAGSRYPDVMVTCKPIPRGAKTTDSAVFVAEVLSPSTLRLDRGEKVENYEKVEGLDAYLIVDPNVRDVTLYRRKGKRLVEVDTGDTLDLGHGLSVTMDDIYADVLK